MFTFIKNLFKNNKKQVELPFKLTKIVQNNLGEFGVQERNEFDIKLWHDIVYHWYPTRKEAEKKQIEIERDLLIKINKLNFKEV